jgi:hypothetical protein
LKRRSKERKYHRVELVVSLGYKGPSTIRTSISLREKRKRKETKKRKEKERKEEQKE